LLKNNGVLSQEDAEKIGHRKIGRQVTKLLKFNNSQNAKRP